MNESHILKALRYLSGMNKERAARLSGLSIRTITSAESGQSCTDKTMLALLAVYESAGARIVKLTNDDKAQSPLIKISYANENSLRLINLMIDSKKQ